jgi:alpha-glucosidase
VLAGRRDPARTPMRWTPGDRGGFTTGEPWLPMGQDLASCNAKSESEDPNSILSLYRRLLRLRRAQPALALGDYVDLPCDDECLVYFRRHAGCQLLVMLNFSKSKRRIALPREMPHGRLLLSSEPGRALGSVRDSIELVEAEGVVLEAA